MQFTSTSFFVFFAVVLALHRLPLSWTWRKFNLLWLSYLFYAAWNPPFVVLLWVSTVVDWFLARAIHRSESPGRRKVLLVASLLVNLGMLGYFKYAGFLLENTVALFQSLGIGWEPPALDIVLPIGISFYTFQTLSYTLDVYKGRLKPWDRFIDYALFVTFFPQLVAGPIVRARQFLPQCRSPRRVDVHDLGLGAGLFVAGLFQKVVLADALLAPSVEAVFDVDLPARALDAWVGCFAFVTEIFCDFAGYSLCAIGVARMLGFELPLNFRHPLAAIGFTDFWQRWHISLSTWIRDYVYASIRGTGKTSFNRFAVSIMLTWSLIGLWHGAQWGFVIWGAYSGLFLIAERVARNVAPTSALWATTPCQFVFAAFQFTVFASSGLPFRGANDPERMTELFWSLVGQGAAAEGLLNSATIELTVAVVIAVFLYHWFMRRHSFERLAISCPWYLRSILLAAMLVLIVISQGRDRAFLYFQF
ncbi:MAG: MBOAT family O-acyltransferase [Planctomycetota bacterium]